MSVQVSSIWLVVLSTDAEDPVGELEGNVDRVIKGLSIGPSA
jgi:hypothetical protein